MPVQINDRTLEAHLEREAKAGPVPTNKKCLTLAIVRTVLAAAETRKVNVREILDGLTDQDHQPHAA